MGFQGSGLRVQGVGFERLLQVLLKIQLVPGKLSTNP